MACGAAAVEPGRPDPPLVAVAVKDAAGLDALSDAEILDAIAVGTEDAVLGPEDDPMALHYEDEKSLRVLMGDAGSIGIPVSVGPWKLSQGNRAIARHSVGRRACLQGLRDVVVQSPEQHAHCGGADAMVPVWERGGGIESARFCIDVFEFPDKACELPFVFVTPAQADRICHLQGKRLCTQEEWNLACRADPEGGPDRVYAYGNELDLGICNTNKTRSEGLHCDVSTNGKLWTTCGTNTEPSGAFPKCRSRFGVFDQHGNVAEIMTRFEPADGLVYSQLKGSAFFYVDVAKTPTDPGGYWTKYPDHCNFDPRWHVEKMTEASHMNYHLGFRCCRNAEAHDGGGSGARDASAD
jgi:sulfatase modifying factor 1